VSKKTSAPPDEERTKFWKDTFKATAEKYKEAKPEIIKIA